MHKQIITERCTIGLLLPGLLLCTYFLSSVALAQDADGDGVLDIADLCPGPDGTDLDGDGWPSGCDCDESDNTIFPTAADSCDTLDNNCDERIDVHTLLQGSHGHLVSLLGRGIARTPTSTTQWIATTDTGQVASTVAPGGTQFEKVFELPLDIVGGNERVIHVRVDRFSFFGDHDFEVGFSDGLHARTAGTFNASVDGSLYFPGSYYWNDGPIHIHGAAGLVGGYAANVDPMGAGPHVISFYFGTDPKIVFTYDDGSTWESPHPPPDGMSDLDPSRPWTFFLFRDNPYERYTINELEIWQDLPSTGGGVDADGDGVIASCDCDDSNPNAYPGAIEICNGIDLDCGGDGDNAVLMDADARVLISEYARQNALNPSSRPVSLEGDVLRIEGTPIDGEIFFRKPLGQLSRQVELVVDRVVPDDLQNLFIGFGRDGEQFVGVGILDSRTVGYFLDNVTAGNYSGALLDSLVATRGPTLPRDGARRMLFDFDAGTITTTVGDFSVVIPRPDLRTFIRPGSRYDVLFADRFVPNPHFLRRVEIRNIASDLDGDGICDGRDFCAGPDGDEDLDGDGVLNRCDCNDENAFVRPGIAEICDGIDQDCDGRPDVTFAAGGSAAELLSKLAGQRASTYEGVTLSLNGEFLGASSDAVHPVLYREEIDAPHESLEIEIDLGNTGTVPHNPGFFLSDGSQALAIRLTSGPPYHNVFVSRAVVEDRRTQMLNPAIVDPIVFRNAFFAQGGIFRAKITWEPEPRIRFEFRDNTGRVFIADDLVSPGTLPARSTTMSAGLFGANYSWNLPRIERFTLKSFSVHVPLADADADTTCDDIDICAGFEDALDGDADGIPDYCDICVGENGFDGDGDGVPSGCDCDDSNASRATGRTDQCNRIDDDCDGAIDVHTAMTLRGAEALYRVATGESILGDRRLVPEEGGHALRVLTGTHDEDIYYRQSLILLPPASAAQRISVLVDRAPRVGDHDFQLFLSDGTSAIGLAIFDEPPSNGSRSSLAALHGTEDGEQVSKIISDPVAIDEASPYTITFTIGASPRIDVISADGTMTSLELEPDALGSIIPTSPLELLLVGQGADEEYLIRDLVVTQALPDSDGDGFCNEADYCEGEDDGGVDVDGDLVVDACDICPDGSDFGDADNDTVPDACDICPDSDDHADRDGDALPDACDECPDDPANDNDNDGVCDMSDICLGGDDTLDSDEDGIPDFCDECPIDNMGDSDEDGTCDAADICIGDDRSGDQDGDGHCADRDCDDTRAHIFPGAEEICDGFDSNCSGALRADEFDSDGDLIIDCLAESGSGCSAAGQPLGNITWFVFYAFVLLQRRVSRF